MAKWLDWTVIEVAFIVAASAFSNSGGIARSLPAITNQDGLVFQAAVVMVAAKAAALVGAWVAVRIFLSFSGRSWAKSSAIPFGVIERNPCASGRISSPNGAGGYGLLIEVT